MLMKNMNFQVSPLKLLIYYIYGEAQKIVILMIRQV